MKRFPLSRGGEWILFTGFLFLGLQGVFASAEEGAVGKIIGISGTIEYLAGEGTPVAEAQPGEVRPVSLERWEKVKFHQPIYAHDRLRTGKRSRLRVLMNDKSLIAVGPNSSVEIMSYLHKEDQKLRQGVIGIAHGLTMYLVNKSQTHKDSSFKIVTPTANVAARGTQGFVKSSSEVTFVANKAGVVDANTRTDECDELKKLTEKDPAKLTQRVGAAMGTKIEKCKAPTEARPINPDDFKRILDVIIGIPGVTTASVGGEPLIQMAGGGGPSDDFVTELEGLGESFGDGALFSDFNDPFQDSQQTCVQTQ